MSQPGEPDPNQPPPIPDYQLLRKIGGGAYGDVWLARGVTGIFRAVKVVWGNRFDSSTPYEREFRGLREVMKLPPDELRHLAIMHVGRNDELGYFYYVMELGDDANDPERQSLINPGTYVPATFKEVLIRRRKLPARETVDLGIEVALGLAVLHRHGLIHRDIKPGNIIFVQGRPKLADIGLVIPEDRSQTMEIGTLGYMPRANAGTKSADTFALGKVLYELCTGLDRDRFPELQDDLPLIANDPEFYSLNQILLTACSEEPTKRYPSAEEMLAELRLLQAGKSIVALRNVERRLAYMYRLAQFAAGIGVLVGIFAWREIQNRRKLQAELYRESVNLAAVNIERAKLGDARRALADAKLILSNRLETQILNRQARGDGRIFQPHQGKVDKLAFDDSNSRLAVLYEDGSLFVLSVPDGVQISQISRVQTLAGFIDHGKKLVGTRSTRPYMNALCVWDLDTKTSTDFPVSGNNHALGILSDGKTISFANDDHLNKVGFLQGVTPFHVAWRTVGGVPLPDPFLQEAATDPTGNQALTVLMTGEGDTAVRWLYHTNIAKHFGHTTIYPGRRILSPAISPDGQYAAYGIEQTGELISVSVGGPKTATNVLNNKSYGITHTLGWAPNGHLLAAGGSDEMVRILPPDTLRAQWTFRGHGAGITSLAWNKAGNQIASADSVGEVRLYDIHAEMHHDTLSGFKTKGGPPQLVVSPDGTLLAASATTNSIVLVAPDTFTRKAELMGVSTPLAFDATSQYLWAIGSASKLLKIDCHSGKSTKSYDLFSTNKSSPFGGVSTDGSRLLAYDGKTASLWKLGNVPMKLLEKTSHKNGIVDFAFSTDHPLAATVADYEIVYWDYSSNQVQKYPISEEAFCACFVPGSRSCLLGTKRNHLIKFTPGEKMEESIIPISLSETVQLLYLPDLNRVVASGDNGQLGILAGDSKNSRFPYQQLLLPYRHYGLSELPGGHSIIRLAHVPRYQYLFGITTDGLLVRW